MVRVVPCPTPSTVVEESEPACGTELEPGIDLLERAADFPANGPILIVTDAQCDVVRVRREHAFLVPVGAILPFTPHGPVFRMS